MDRGPSVVTTQPLQYARCYISSTSVQTTKQIKLNSLLHDQSGDHQVVHLPGDVSVSDDLQVQVWALGATRSACPQVTSGHCCPPMLGLGCNLSVSYASLSGFAFHCRPFPRPPLHDYVKTLQSCQLSPRLTSWPPVLLCWLLADCNWHFLHRRLCAIAMKCIEMTEYRKPPSHSSPRITTVALPWLDPGDQCVTIICSSSVSWFRNSLTDTLTLAIKIRAGDSVSLTWSAPGIWCQTHGISHIIAGTCRGPWSCWSLAWCEGWGPSCGSPLTPPPSPLINYPDNRKDIGHAPEQSWQCTLVARQRGAGPGFDGWIALLKP